MELVSSVALVSKIVDEFRLDETFSIVTLPAIEGSICRVDFVSDDGGEGVVFNKFVVGSGGGGGGGQYMAPGSETTLFNNLIKNYR